MSLPKTSESNTGRKIKTQQAEAKARFDARLTVVQKRVIEEAARIKGFKSVSEFVIQTTMDAATIIIERHHAILVSENDKEIFFKALLNPPKPNDDLMRAAELYKDEVGIK
jgi:uncharacterized protein (DUF1778 family)